MAGAMIQRRRKPNCPLVTGVLKRRPRGGKSNSKTDDVQEWSEGEEAIHATTKSGGGNGGTAIAGVNMWQSRDAALADQQTSS